MPTKSDSAVDMAQYMEWYKDMMAGAIKNIIDKEILDYITSTDNFEDVGGVTFRKINV